MSRRLPALAITFLCLLPAASRAGCDLAHFGDKATATCVRSAADCIPGYLPKEIRAITKGAVLETIGLATNEGRATWRALDLEHNAILVIERYAGRRVGQAPKVDSATENDYLSTVDPEPRRVVDHVRRYPVSAERAATLACLVSGVGSGTVPPVRNDSDIGSRFYLLLGESAYTSMTTGRFLGAPGAFGGAVDEAVRRQQAGRQGR